MSDSQYAIRPVRPQDVPAVVAMVYELAEVEKQRHECRLTEEQLHASLFGPAAALFGHVALDESGAPVGMALWFLNYSTWDGQHGIYLEDLYVRPQARRTGIGRALLATLAALCMERGYSRLDWAVLDWNPARQFYESLGARPRSEWIPHRIDGAQLTMLAATA